MVFAPRKARSDRPFRAEWWASSFGSWIWYDLVGNLNIHRRKALADVFGAEMAAEVWDRFTVHYTPTHGGWLNQAEIEIGMFSRQCLGKRRIPSLKILRAEARAWNRRMNRDRVKIAWNFDRKAARRKFSYNRKSFKRSTT